VYNIINVYYSVAAAAALVADEYSLEASRYLKECFGDVQRIDYGTVINPIPLLKQENNLMLITGP
jgi:hypothetical protein